MNKKVIWPRIIINKLGKKIKIINKLGIKIQDNNEIIKIRIKMLMASWIKE